MPTFWCFSWGDEQYRKLQFLYFILATTARYFVKLIICPFLDHNQSSHYYHIYPTPPLGQDMTQGQFLSEV